jgi:hypothetical protein
VLRLASRGRVQFQPVADSHSFLIRTGKITQGTSVDLESTSLPVNMRMEAMLKMVVVLNQAGQAAAIGTQNRDCPSNMVGWLSGGRRL